MFNFIKKLFKKKKLSIEKKYGYLIKISCYIPRYDLFVVENIEELDKYKAFNHMHDNLDKLFDIQLTYDDIQALEEIKKIVIDDITIEYNPYFPMEIINYG